MVLREFGDQAEEAIRRLEANGWDVDSHGPPEMPWEEARAVMETRLMPTPDEERIWVESALRWPTTLTAGWVQEHYTVGNKNPIDAAVLADIEALVSEELEQGRALGDDMLRLLRLGLKQVWDRDQFDRRPFLIWTDKPRGGPYCKTDREGGWCYGIFVEWEDVPGMLDLYRQGQALASARDKKVTALLRRHG